nr:uncharacterized protein LOC122269339 [Parasteatoda tepidariorum]
MEIRTNIKISNNITEVSNIAGKPNHVEKYKKCKEEVMVSRRECKLIKLYEEDDKIFPVSSDESLFWGMHLKRKAVIENMNENIENLVKECLYWKQQLNALEDSNRILKNEKQSLLREYEELLEKTRHDDNIVLKLKNSEKELQKEEVEGLQLNRKIRTADSVKNLLSNDKSALEKKRNALIGTLETHNKKLEQINVGSVKETSEDHFSSADEDFSETDNPTTFVMSDALMDKRIEDIDQYQKGQSNSKINERALQFAKEENRFLLETYSWLNGK